MPDTDADLIARLRRGTEGLTSTGDPSARILGRVRVRRRRRRLGAVGAGLSAVALVGVAIGVAVPASGGHRTTVDVSAPPPAPPAATARSVLSAPEGLAVAPDGDLLIDNQGTSQILDRNADGRLVVVAGNGHAGFGGDGAVATRAELNQPDAIAVTPDGTIYVADTGNNRIRAISAAGVITTVAGDGSSRGRTTGPARRIALSDPTSVAVGSKGQVYVTDAAGVQMVEHGTVRTVSPAGHLMIHSVDRPLEAAWFPSELAVSTSGDLYVADESPKLLLELAPNGGMVRTLGSVTRPVYASGLATGGSGSVWVADYGRFALDSIYEGSLRRVVTFTRNELYGLTGTFRPSAVAVAPDGTVYLATDGRNGGTNRPALVEIQPGGKPVLLSDRQVGPAPLPDGFVLHLNGIGTARFGQSATEAEREIRAGFVGTGRRAPPLSFCGDMNPVGGIVIDVDRQGRFSGYLDYSPVLQLGPLHVGMTSAEASRVVGAVLTLRYGGEVYDLRAPAGSVSLLTSPGSTTRPATVVEIGAGTGSGCPAVSP